MVMHPNKHINFMLRLLYLAVIGGLIYVGFKYALKWALPLIIAYLISCIIIRPVNFFASKRLLPRHVGSIIFTLLTVTLLGLLIYWLISTLVYQGTQLAASLPQMLESLSDRLANVQVAFDDFFVRLPGSAEGPMFSFDKWLGSIQLPEINVGGIFSSAAGVASSLPGFLISLVFVFVATYFLTSARGEIMGFLRRQTGDKAFDMFSQLKAFFSTSVLKWIKAQCILICITFVILCIWFLILKQPYAFLLAILIAIIDALPILGVGTVMIPWALVDLLSGDFRMAIFHILVYVSVLAVRNSIEPKIVGTQLGIHPFVSLLCVYFGFRLAGFFGMFLMPVIVLCLIQLQETGRIHLWK